MVEYPVLGLNTPAVEEWGRLLLYCRNPIGLMASTCIGERGVLLYSDSSLNDAKLLEPSRRRRREWSGLRATGP